MRDFPPRHRAYLTPAADARPGARPDEAHERTHGRPRVRAGDRPDTRSPAAFLWWIVRSQRDVLTVSLLVATAWMVPQTLGPWLLGMTIDAGILPGHSSADDVLARLTQQEVTVVTPRIGHTAPAADKDPA